jgi:hypothetical protein
MQIDHRIVRFDAARCRPGLRLRANQMIRALLDEDAADRWASHGEEDGDSINPDDLAGLVPPPREMWRIDDATLACMLQDFAVMGVFAIQSGQFDGRFLLESLMDLQASACAVAQSCAAGARASVEPFPKRAAATQTDGAAMLRGIRP